MIPLDVKKRLAQIAKFCRCKEPEKARITPMAQVANDLEQLLKGRRRRKYNLKAIRENKNWSPKNVFGWLDLRYWPTVSHMNDWKILP